MSTQLSDRIDVIPAFGNLSIQNQRRLVQWTALLLVVLAWEVMGRILGSNLFAPASEVAVTYVELLMGPIIPLMIVTAKDMFVGFGLAAAFALPVGILMGRWKPAEAALDPWVTALFATATSALLPLIIVLFGLDFAFRIAIVWLACVWHMLLTVYHGAQSVDRGILDVSRSFGTSKTKTFWSVILPAISPSVMSAFRLGTTRSIRGIILAEFYVAHGYGGFLREVGNTSISTAPVLALALTLMFAGFGLRKSMGIVQRRLVPWADVESER